jgi:DNA-binding NtrC family response regulator
MNAATARKLNFLIVDDDEAMVRLLHSLLTKQLGGTADVHVLTDAEAARDWLTAHPCDVLISDIEMPGLDGLELLRVAKSCNVWTQVVFITGHSSVSRLIEAVALGAADYLLKPLDREEILEVVEQLGRRCARWQSAMIETFSLKPVATSSLR